MPDIWRIFIYHIEIWFWVNSSVQPAGQSRAAGKNSVCAFCFAVNSMIMHQIGARGMCRFEFSFDFVEMNAQCAVAESCIWFWCASLNKYAHTWFTHCACCGWVGLIVRSALVSGLWIGSGQLWLALRRRKKLWSPFNWMAPAKSDLFVLAPESSWRFCAFREFCNASAYIRTTLYGGMRGILRGWECADAKP